jgi:hypothetical protein
MPKSLSRKSRQFESDMPQAKTKEKGWEEKEPNASQGQGEAERGKRERTGNALTPVSSFHLS